MAELILWKNREMDRLRKDMDRLLARFHDDFCSPLLLKDLREEPLLELSETPDALLLRAEVPEARLEDLDVTIDEDLLTIRAEQAQQTSSDDPAFRGISRSRSFFSRVVRLPCKIREDEVQATYKGGVLSMILPKRSPKKTREIKIKIT